MPAPKPGRGRPRGSGLDDSAELVEIARRLDRDPALRPTTAIKQLGISDPSTVRRLRDKLALMRRGSKETRSDAAPARPIPRIADAARQPVTGSPKPQAEATGALPQGAELLLASNPSEMLALIGGLGLRAMAASVEFQFALIDQALRFPPLTAALKSQLMLNEFTLSLCVPRGGERKTLH